MEYLRKTITLILLIVITSMPIYGAEVIPTNNIDQYIEIINPSVEAGNNVEVRNNFFVSFNIKKEADMYLTINKIVPVMDTIFLDKIIANEMEQSDFIDSLTLRVLEINGLILDEDMTDQEKTDYILRKIEIKDVIKNYVESYVSERIAYKKYIAVQKELEVIKNNMKSEDVLIVMPNSYDEVREDYREKRSALKANKKLYDELFKVSVLEKDPIESEGVMPYYEKTIENIKYGEYELVIELMTEEGLIELKSFNINIQPHDNVDEYVLTEKEIKLIQPMDSNELEE